MNMDVGMPVSVTDQMYAPLREALEAAYSQAAYGKGKERHANDKSFSKQPIMEIARMVGPGYQLGQAMKKAQESSRMLERGKNSAAQAELLGAINYLAAAWCLINETKSIEELCLPPAVQKGAREKGAYVVGQDSRNTPGISGTMDVLASDEHVTEAAKKAHKDLLESSLGKDMLPWESLSSYEKSGYLNKVVVGMRDPSRNINYPGSTAEGYFVQQAARYLLKY